MFNVQLGKAVFEIPPDRRNIMFTGFEEENGIKPTLVPLECGCYSAAHPVKGRVYWPHAAQENTR